MLEHLATGTIGSVLHHRPHIRWPALRAGGGEPITGLEGVHMLTHQQAKAFYDRFGSKQDSQAFYEDRAINELVVRADFESANHVFEFGVGTGRLAERLLSQHLSGRARFTGSDISTTMLELAQTRLSRFGNRVELVLSNGAAVCPVPAASVDRIVSSYVLDLLPEQEIITFLSDCARALTAGGRLCLVGLTFGEGLGSRLVTAGWRALFRISPAIVGGCRPIRLEPLVVAAGLATLSSRVVTSFGIASEVLVAERRGGS